MRNRAAAALLLAAGLLSNACGGNGAAVLAQRVLEDHRRKAAVRPLPASGSLRIRLSPAGPAGGEDGSAEVEWAGARYRETVTSAGVTTVRGIQAGKAFFTDEDGVTRVGSEPMLAALITRSYFWRRAYLFDDHARARLSLGPAGPATVSVILRVLGGNPLELTFDRKTGALRAADSPRFHLEFESATRWRDRGPPAVFGDVFWSGLPTRRLPDPVVGGWSGQFAESSAEAELHEEDGGIFLPATVSGVAARLSLDADVSGPLRVSADLARQAGLSPRRDVFGRQIAGGASLAVGSFTMPSIHVVIDEALGPGRDAVAGGTLYRETVVEIDPAGHRLRLHDPGRWVAPEGFGRNVLDDDGDRPVALLFRAGRRLRLRAGVTDASALVLPEELLRQLAPEERAPRVDGVVWGTLRLPPLPARSQPGEFDPAWGDDGAIGFPLLLRFRTFIDMPHRWVYLKPLETTPDH